MYHNYKQYKDLTGLPDIVHEFQKKIAIAFKGNGSAVLYRALY